MSRAEQLLAQYPGPLTLHASWLQWSATLFFCSAGSLVGAYAAITRTEIADVLGYGFAATFFGLGTLITLALLWRGGNSLTLAADGLQWSETLVRVGVSWDRASSFEAFDGSRDGNWLPNMQVRFRLDHPGAPLPDPSVIVPDKYGLTAPELAWLMNQWRAKAVDRKNAP